MLLLHGGSIDRPTFIYHHILYTFKVSSHKIGLPYAYLIYDQVISLGITFLKGISGHVSHPIGQVSQQCLLIPQVILFRAILQISLFFHLSLPSVLIFYCHLLPPPLVESITKSASVFIDPSIALMDQMSVLIEQQAHMNGRDHTAKSCL